MKSSSEVLMEKEKALETVRREVEALRIVARLLADTTDAVPKKPAKSEDWNGLQSGTTDFAARNGSATLWP